MPVIIELRLRAHRATRSPYVPTTVQLHGLACALFEDTAGADHDGQDKPFSIWPLSETPGGWLLRAAWLGPGIPQAALAACGQLRVGPIFCTATDIALRPVSFGDLAATPPCASIRLEFRSPVYFSQNGTRTVTPDPRLIAGSWRRRWNAAVPASSDLAISEEEWRDLSRVLRLTDFDLSTSRRDTGYGRDQSGFTGTAAIRVDKNGPEQARARLATLARFAEFCGTGAQTTHGFGATMLSTSPR